MNAVESDTHAALWTAETTTSDRDASWYAWIDEAERIAGHSLDGDEPSGDAYSLDSAYEAWEAGTSPAAYVRTFQLTGHVVAIDGQTFTAAALLPGTWNGFVRPLFTADEALRILGWHNAGTTEFQMIDERGEGQGDSFNVYESDGDGGWEPNSSYPGVTHDGQTLYAIGADAWAWVAA